jgi:hypothetical protein
VHVVASTVVLDVRSRMIVSWQLSISRYTGATQGAPGAGVGLMPPFTPRKPLLSVDYQ